MASASTLRRLIVNADDFGRSASINTAVVRAHTEGVLTSASVMVNGDAFAESVSLAREHPTLGVGLHLTLVCGAATLPPASLPGLVNDRGEFANDPVRSGLRYFVRRDWEPLLRAEITAQFEKFASTGLPLDHVNGHLNMHLHPTVFRVLSEIAPKYGVRAWRLTRDPFWLNARLASGRWLYRASHAFIYWLLSRRARPVLSRQGVRWAPHVFGLLQNAQVDESFVLRLLPALPAGDSELYSHPSLDEFRNEMDALVSPAVRACVEREGIQLVRYQDL
jgi:hopanoid biosynthesis associated protein HpnK